MSLLCLAITLTYVNQCGQYFGTNVTEKVRSQMCFIFPPQVPLPESSRKTKIASFHWNAVLLHCQTSNN